ASRDRSEGGQRIGEMLEDVEHDHEVEHGLVFDRAEVAHEHGCAGRVACGRGRGDSALAPESEPAALAERTKHPARAASELERDAGFGSRACQPSTRRRYSRRSTKAARALKRR